MEFRQISRRNLKKKLINSETKGIGSDLPIGYNFFFRRNVDEKKNKYDSRGEN